MNFRVNIISNFFEIPCSMFSPRNINVAFISFFGGIVWGVFIYFKLKSTLTWLGFVGFVHICLPMNVPVIPKN